MLLDKQTIQQVLGSLIKKPQLLSEIDRYELDIKDFSSKLDKYIFSAISGLYAGGATKISILDIENYLSTNDSAAVYFKQQNGIEYLQDIEDLTDENNFQYYYDKLKKINLLRNLKKQGIDIKEFYIEDLADENSDKVNAKFEELTTSDIIDSIKRKLLRLESEYVNSGDITVSEVDKGIDQLFEDLGKFEDMGLPVQGHIQTQILGGARLGTLTLRSAASGVGKTRNAVADACYLAFPIRFNWTTCKWERNGFSEKVLFVLTEQQLKEIQKMIISYISGINETKIKMNKLDELERKVLQHTLELIHKYSKNFILVRIPEPSVGVMKSVVREQCVVNKVQYLFMDYIFVNPSLLREFKDFKLRNDEALLLLTTCLKDLAVELNICAFTSSQLNAKGDEDKDIKNESALAGARSIINKCDNGLIASRPSKEDLETLEGLNKQGIETPNLVFDVFKVRNGQWTQVKIWSYMDYGTLRRKDLFITDANYNAITDFYDFGVVEIDSLIGEDLREVEKIIKDLNEIK